MTGNSKTFNRVVGLVAQADNAATEAERDAFMGKAQALASAIGIELAVARQAQHDRTKRETPEERRILVNAFSRRNNRKHFVQLFNAVAEVNDCQVLIGSTNYYCWPTGFPTDLDVVEALYASLALQMEQAANDALKRGEQRTAGWHGGRIDGRIYRANFYDGFISRTRARLWAAKREAERAAGVTHPVGQEVTGTEIALRDKRKEVLEAVENSESWKRAGNWKGPQARDWDYSSAAREHGQRAAASARLDNDDSSVESSKTRAIG